MAVRCPMCPGTLVAHCSSPSCSWLQCRRPWCAAEVLDVRTGRLRLNTGVVLVRGDA